MQSLIHRNDGAIVPRELEDLDITANALLQLGPRDAQGERKSLEAEVSVRVNKELLAAVSDSQALVNYTLRVPKLFRENFDHKRF